MLFLAIVDVAESLRVFIRVYVSESGHCWAFEKESASVYVKREFARGPPVKGSLSVVLRQKSKIDLN